MKNKKKRINYEIKKGEKVLHNLLLLRGKGSNALLLRRSV